MKKIKKEMAENCIFRFFVSANTIIEKIQKTLVIRIIENNKISGINTHISLLVFKLILENITNNVIVITMLSISG